MLSSNSMIIAGAQAITGFLPISCFSSFFPLHGFSKVCLYSIQGGTSRILAWTDSFILFSSLLFINLSVKRGACLYSCLEARLHNFIFLMLCRVCGHKIQDLCELSKDHLLFVFSASAGTKNQEPRTQMYKRSLQNEKW